MNPVTRNSRIRRPSQETSAVVVVGIALFADTAIYFLLVPLLPHFAERFSLGPIGVGALVWSYSAALLASSLPVGRILENRGRRAPMLAGLGMLALSTFLFAWSDSYWMLVLARIVQGVSGAVTWVTGLALLADCAPPERRGRDMGIVLALANLGFVLGPTLSGWLAQHAGPRAPFMAAALLLLLDAALRAFLLRDPDRLPSVPLNLSKLLKNQTLVTLAGVGATGAAMTTLLEAALPVHLNRTLGLTPDRIGLLFGIMAAAHLATAPLVGAISDRTGRRRIIRTGFLAQALIVPFAVFAHTFLAQAIALALLGATASLLLSPVGPAAADASESGSRSHSSVFALINLGFASGMLIGPAVGSLLEAAFGLQATVLILGTSSLLWWPMLKHIRT